MKKEKGALSYKTRYETRTRVLDAMGNEISDGVGVEAIAPPHPDVEGQNPETAGGKRRAEEVREQPATVDAKADSGNERSGERIEKQKPRPGSEGNEATKQ